MPSSSSPSYSMTGPMPPDWTRVIVEDDGRRPELEAPNIRYFLTKEFYVPFLLYFAFFRFASWVVKNYLWQSYAGFKRYRLQNLSVCFLHSCITGIWCICFVLAHPYEMFYNYVYYYDSFNAQISILSVAYFLQDALDMLSFEWSRWTRELLLHHFMTGVSLLTPVPNKRYLIPVYWALMMEINSIFLHARTIMQLSGYKEKEPQIYKGVVYANIFSFVTCRFLSIIVYQWWGFNYIGHMHWWYVMIGLCGPFAFHIINGFLFFRVLAADGYLSERLKSEAAINRDDQKLMNGNEKCSNGTTSVGNGVKKSLLDSTATDLSKFRNGYITLNGYTKKEE